NAHLVDARLDDAVQRLLELLGVDVVLILADADVLRVDLDQLAERVLQAPANGDGAAQRRVEGGELFLGDVGGRVVAGAGLVDDDVGEVGGRRRQSDQHRGGGRVRVPGRGGRGGGGGGRGGWGGGGRRGGGGGGGR